jgi:anti-sigma factor RsiW
MTHLGERITDYVFGEMSGKELEEARRHIADCSQCRDEVSQVERTRATLRLSQDLEPPRHITFEVEKRPAFNWRWLAPIGAAAAVIIAVLIAAPMSIQWNESQLTISFGTAPAPAVRNETANVQSPVRAVSEPVDYDRIISEVQKQLRSQQPSVSVAPVKLNAEQTKIIQRLDDRLVYLENVQKSIERQNAVNADAIAQLTQKSEREEQ